MSTSVSTTEPRTAALVILAPLPLPKAAESDAVDDVSEDPRVGLIRKANAEATQIAKTLADKLKAGENGGDAGRALKIELAKARLKALRLAAVAAAAAHDGKRALGIAKEVADVARDLKAMAGSQSTDPDIPTTAPDPTPTATASPAAATTTAATPPDPTPAASPAAATAPAAATSDDPEIQGLLAHARATLTILRKAAKPGSEEERQINRLLGGVGTTSLETDLTPTADQAHIDLSV